MVIHYHNIFLWYICLLKDTRKTKDVFGRLILKLYLFRLFTFCVFYQWNVFRHICSKNLFGVWCFKGLRWGGVWLLLICFCGYSGQVGCIQKKICYALHGSPSLGDCFSSWRKIQAEFRSTSKYVWLSGFIKILFSRRYDKF